MLTAGQFSRHAKPPPGSLFNIVHPIAYGLGYYLLFNEYSGVAMSLRETLPGNRAPKALLGSGGSWAPNGLLVNSAGENGPRYAGMNWTTAATLMAHVTIESVTGDYPAVLSKRNAGGDSGWQFNKSDTSSGMNMYWGSGTLRGFGQIWPGTGEHMFVVTYDEADSAEPWKAYIDGKLAGSNATSGYPPFAADTIYVNLGIAYPSYTSYMTAIYHSVAFWVDHALTDAEVALLWRNPYCMFEFAGRQAQWGAI